MPDKSLTETESLVVATYDTMLSEITAGLGEGQIGPARRRVAADLTRLVLEEDRWRNMTMIGDKHA